MKPVIDPMSLATVCKDTAVSQLRQMPGDLWLDFVQCKRQLAYAQFFLAGYQHRHSRSRLVCQAFENSGGGQLINHRNRELNISMNIWIGEYIVFRM